MGPGKRWSGELDSHSLAGDCTQTLYAGTSGYGVFRSTDGGAHWGPFNDGLPNLDIRLLALTPGRANALYAGTVSGIFVINLASDCS